MTGDDVAALREKFRLTVRMFADLVGASSATVYRWESLGAAEVKADLWQERLVVLLKGHAVGLTPAESDAFSRDIKGDLLTAGGLFALYRVLHAAFSARGAGAEFEGGRQFADREPMAGVLEWSASSRGHRFVETEPHYGGKYVPLYVCERCGAFAFPKEIGSHTMRSFSTDKEEPRRWTVMTTPPPCRSYG